MWWFNAQPKFLWIFTQAMFEKVSQKNLKWSEKTLATFFKNFRWSPKICDPKKIIFFPWWDCIHSSHTHSNLTEFHFFFWALEKKRKKLTSAERIKKTKQNIVTASMSSSRLIHSCTYVSWKKFYEDLHALWNVVFKSFPDTRSTFLNLKILTFFFLRSGGGNDLFSLTHSNFHCFF